MEDQNMKKLLDEHAWAKKKMTLGIVFTAVAYFLSILGVMTFAFYVGIFFIIASLPFFGVGIPSLIVGIINTIKSNRRISLARRDAQSKAAPKQQEPLTTEPNFTAAATEPSFTAAATEPSLTAAATEPDFSPVTTPTQIDASEVPYLDWEKYNPLDAGVSYKKDKDYKFSRFDGFVGSVPQKFVDRTFPKCPICCSKQANWTITQHNQMSWKGNLYLFKCSHCESIISMSMPDVTTLGNGPSGIVSHANVGLTNLMVKASEGKDAGAVYAVIESVGNSGVSSACEGKEFKLEDLQDMYLR